MLIFQKYQGHSIDMLKCSVNNNHKDFLNTRSGIMPSNCSQAHWHRFQEDSYVFHKTKSKRYRKLWQNIYKEEPSDQGSDHMRQMFSLSKRKMANCVQYKTTALLTNGRRKTATYHH